MDISLKFKRALATLSVVTLLVSNASVVLAQTFNDVATNSWYYTYVEKLVNDGVVDAASNYRPNSALNRAELVKMVITAVDGLSGYTAPATPTFSDVPTSAWFYDYVEAAAQLNIVGGYTDAAGHPTGKFGPSDTVNRAAATKILVNAFGVPTTLTPASKFPDVVTGTWFYDYVVTAYNQSILDGYANGKFGPADAVTRAQVAKLIVNSQSPVVRVAGTTPGTTPTPTSTGALEVSLNDTTPHSATVPIAATSVNLLTFDLTAAQDDVKVSSVSLTRGGVGNASDWDSIYLYDGAKRLTTGRTINNDTNMVTLPVNLTVDAGTTKTLRVVGQMSSTPTANNQHYFYIASAADITSNAQSVAGDFPVAGNTFTTGSVTVNSLELTAGSTPSDPQVGAKDVEVSSFKLAAGASNDIALHQISLTQNGSLANSKLTNLKLLRGTDVVATADGFTGDLATFVLTTPYIIPKGQNKVFYVHADINGGRPGTDTIQLYLDENTDVVAIDQQYGYGAVITNTSFKVTGVTALTLKGGKVTVTDNGPVSGQVAQNAKNIDVFDYAITADRDLLVKNSDLTLYAGIGTNYTDVPAATATTTISGAGNLRSGFDTAADLCGGTAATCIAQTFSVTVAGTTYYCAITSDAGNSSTAGTDTKTSCPSITLAGGEAVTYGIDPYQYIENVRIIDVDSGATLNGPVTRWNATTTKSGTTETTYSKQMTEDYDLTAGETRHLRVVVDLNKNAPAGLEISANVNYNTAGYIKDVNANTDLALADLVGGSTTSKKQTIQANSLIVSKTSNIVSQSFVKGSKGVAALQISAQAGDAGDINLKKLTFRAYGDNDGNFSDGGGTTPTGDTEAKTFVSSASLYDGNNLIAGPKSLELTGCSTFAAETAGCYDKILFDNLNLVVPKGQTKNYTVKLDLLNNFTGAAYVALDMNPNTDIVAEDKDANTVDANSGNLNYATGALAMNPLETLVQSGTLTATSTSGSIPAQVVTGGTTDFLVSQYSFTAEKEAFNINKLTIINDDPTNADFNDATDTNIISNVKITYPDVNGVEQTASSALPNGQITLSGLGFYVPKDASATLKVFVSVPTISASTFTLSGKKFTVGLLETGTSGVANTSSTFEAFGVDSSTAEYFDVNGKVKNTANIVTQVARKAKPVFTAITPSSTSLTSTNNLYQFTVKAEGGDVSLARVAFDVNVNLSGTVNVYNFKFQSGSSVSNVSDVQGVNIFQDGGTNLKAAASGAGITANGLTNVIVSFDNEETISAGSTKTYVFKADQTGATTTGDSITTKISSGDENAEVGSIGANFDNDNGVGNTTEVYVGAVAGTGLFVAATGVGLGQTLGTARNVIWSDMSGGDITTPGGSAAASAVHSYPTVSGGTVTAGTGTVDFTNGYLLKVEQLNSIQYKQ